MPIRWNLREHAQLGTYLLKWTLLAGPIAAAIGSACALFLWLLDWATACSGTHPELLYFLPLAGVGIALLYQWIGKSRGSEATTSSWTRSTSPAAASPRGWRR